MVDNRLSPHGGKLVERVLDPKEAPGRIAGLKTVPVKGQTVRECVSLAYGFFSPLEGFMGRADVDAVVNKMQLASGYVWSVPLVFDMPKQQIDELEIRTGDSILLTFREKPLVILEIEEIFTYDKELMAGKIFGTTETKHPGVRRTYGYADHFLGGRVTLVSEPIIREPFKRFWKPPAVLRKELAAKGWERAVAHQTRNVPHTGHEWLMKGAWFASQATGVLVNPVVGEKRAGDYIDEAIILGQDVLREAGYFREDVHAVSLLFWDMRYAGPREAVFHAIVRKNLGCTHHMFGRDHAGVGDYYGTYDAHKIFDTIPDVGIYPVLTKEWYYCPVCAGITYEGLCGHQKSKQKFSGSVIRSIIQDGVKPPRLIFRPEVFDVVMSAAEEYGFGSPFVTERYLAEAQPVLTMPDVKK